MKKIFPIIVFYCLLTNYSKSQIWSSYEAEQYTSSFLWTQGATFNQQFKINEYDSSLWFLRGSKVFRLDSEGQLSEFNSSTVPIFNNFLVFNDVIFTSDATYLLERDQGLYRYKNDSWLKISNVSEGVNLSSDLDTIWCSRVNQPYFIIEPMSQSFGLSNIRKSASKHGHLWGINAVNNGYLRKYQNDGSFLYYSADTIGYLLDNKHYHFKFSRNNELFYTSGDKGISIANGNNFIDTITPFNTSNMPDLSVLEFEFDQDDNIWAVFGNYSISESFVSIGFLDRDLNEWTSIYDGSNSPIDFANGAVSIEIDPFGNLWVVNGPYLHVLKLGNEPVWLGMEEVSNSNDQVMIFPNPGRDEIKIEFINGNTPKTIQVTDLTGKVVLESISVLSDKMVIDVNSLTSGLYLLKFENILGQTFTERWVKQ